MQKLPTVVMVISPGRTGSSAIAGMLYRLGVPMAADGYLKIDEGNPQNPRGYYECKKERSLELFKASSFHDYVRDRDRESTDLWGLKPGIFDKSGPDWIEALSDRGDRRVVWVLSKRSQQAHARSMFRSAPPKEGLSEAQYFMYYELFFERVQRTLENRKKGGGAEDSVLSVSYEDLLENPKGICRVLAQTLKLFLPEEDLLEAARFVDPSLRNFA